MKFVVTVLLCILMSSAALAQDTSIYDIRTGVVPEGTLVTVRGVVTGTTANGCFLAEAPYDAYRGIWVYTGSATPHGLMDGDDAVVTGIYEEYFGLSEVNVVAAATDGSAVAVGVLPMPAPNPVSAAEIWGVGGDPEPWESCLVMVTDGMTVSILPNSFGEWFADAFDGTEVMFDDFWYDTSQVALSQCYNNATGILNYSFSAFKLEVLADGIPLVDCAVPNSDRSMGEIKAQFR